MRHIITTIIAITVLISTAQANEFFVGIRYAEGHGLQPFVKVNISQMTPNQYNKFNAAENHHLYWGLALYGLGHYTNCKTLKAVGGAIAIDDAIQHLLRVDSPFHMVSNELWKHKIFRDISQKADGLF